MGARRVGQVEADALLEEELIAPSLWLLEAANALWRRSVRGELTAAEAGELLNAPVTSVRIEEDLVGAARLAAELSHPVYDCLYLALALRERTCVVTADQRFHAALADHPTLSGAVRLLISP